jgi:hypothetical protein
MRMSRCIPCVHAERDRVELAFLDGMKLRAISAKFGGGLNKDNLSRHFRNHLPDARRRLLIAGPVAAEALANKAAAESDSLLDRLKAMDRVLGQAFLKAAAVDDFHGLANLAGRRLTLVDRLGSLTGELRRLGGIVVNNNVNNVFALMQHPSFFKFEAGLIEIAASHPAVKSDILALVHRLRDEAEAAPVLEADAVA